LGRFCFGRIEPGEILRLGDTKGSCNLPSLPVRTADVSDLTLSDESIERAQSLFDRSDVVVSVDLVKIDVICLQATEARFDGVHDMSTGGTHVVASGARPAIDLGRENNVLAGNVEILERLSEGLLAFTRRVDVRRVEEIDTSIDCGLTSASPPF